MIRIFISKLKISLSEKEMLLLVLKVHQSLVQLELQCTVSHLINNSLPLVTRVSRSTMVLSISRVRKESLLGQNSLPLLKLEQLQLLCILRMLLDLIGQLVKK